MDKAPVITIDGPSGSGKGTLAQWLAGQLSWHYLDSGALYRATAWAVMEAGLALSDQVGLDRLLASLQLETLAQTDGEALIRCNGTDVTQAIREEAVGVMASQIASNALVRKALLTAQLDSRQFPGLVADGRDMGTVVFVDAQVKLFITASAQARAERRYKQLQSKGISGNLRQIEADLISRDERDAMREVSPTKPASDAVILDTTTLSIADVKAEVQAVLSAHLTL